MTDRQLAILIRSWANRLERELDAVRAELPDDLPRLTTRAYTGGPFDSLLAPKDPEKWIDLDGDYAVLEGLMRLHTELGDAAALLLLPQESEAVSR